MKIAWFLGLMIILCVIAIFSPVLYNEFTGNPDKMEFQRLLTAHGGWHDIKWITKKNVSVRHEIGELSFTFDIVRGRKGVTECVWHEGKFVWERNYWGDKSDMKRLPPAIDKQIGFLADQVWDAFCQGDTP